MIPENILKTYNFNPFQDAVPDWWMRDFHRRHVPYFRGCNKVIDLGAGQGLFLQELQAAHIEGVGIENFSLSANKGIANNVNILPFDIYGFFSDSEGQKLAGACDGVYCCHVVEHLEPIDVLELFRCIKYYCAPNVRVRIITNNPEDISVLGNVFWGDITHKRLYPGKLLEAMARSQGFTETHSEPFLGLKLGRKDTIRRYWDRLFWGKHKWLPNLLMDCK